MEPRRQPQHAQRLLNLKACFNDPDGSELLFQEQQSDPETEALQQEEQSSLHVWQEYKHDVDHARRILTAPTPGVTRAVPTVYSVHL